MKSGVAKKNLFPNASISDCYQVGVDTEIDRIIVSLATAQQVEDLCQVESEAWPGELAASRDLINDRLIANSSSILIAYSIKLNRYVGFITLLPIQSCSNERSLTWDDYNRRSTDLEYIRSLPKPECYYAVSITSSPFAFRGTGKALVRSAVEWCKKSGAKNLTYVIRIPNFSSYYRSGGSIESYYEGLVQGYYIEPAYQVAKASGGKPRGYVVNFYEDEASLNYGVRIVHDL